MDDIERIGDEQFQDYGLQENPVVDNQYARQQADITVIKEFSRTPNFDPKIVSAFRGVLSQSHSNTFLSQKDVPIYGHGFELIRIYKEFETPPQQLSFGMENQVVNMKLDFFSRVKQSEGHTTERRNNRLLLSGSGSNLPIDRPKRKFKMFNVGGE